MQKIIGLKKNGDNTIYYVANNGEYKVGDKVVVDMDDFLLVATVVRDDVKLKEGKLADLAPTMLDIMGLEKPKEMTGETLLVRD